jgi:chromosome partitioning protein
MIIAIANRKGGTGKTTTTVNLAAIWAHKGHNTLVIDMDTQGHCAIGLGIESVPKNTPKIHDIFLKDNVDLSQSIIKSTIDNISLLPANINYEGGGKMSATILREAIEKYELHKKYDRIVIDTPPTLDVVLINAMSLAHGVIVPFVPHHLAAVGVNQFTKLFFQVARRFNRKLKLFGIVPVMADRHLRLHRSVLAKMEKQFGAQRMLSPIRNNIKLAEAFAENLPIIKYAPKSQGAQDYIRLAEGIEDLLRNEDID